MTTDSSSAPMAALTLVASLRAALGAARSVAERRAGRDEAIESMAGAEEAIAAARRRLKSALALLRVRLALGAPDEPAAALVQAFRDRLLAADIAADVADTHRGLLTLYPAVEAGLIEETRLAGAQADRLAGAIDFDEAAPELAVTLDALIEAFNVLG